MALLVGYQWTKTIILAVFCLRVTQCMNTPLVAKESTKDLGKTHVLTTPQQKQIVVPAAVPISFADVAKPSRGQVFRGNQALDKPKVSPGDTEQYFKSIRELTKPSPGLSIEHLNDVRGSIDPYWSAVHINYLAEDFETMFEDLYKLGKAIEKRKPPGGKDHSVSKEGHKITKARLTEVVQDLQAVHKDSLQYIEGWLKRWAATNDVPKPNLFGNKILALTKKTSSGQKKDLTLDPDTIKYFLPKERLEKAFSNLSILSSSYNLDPNEDQHLWALHRIFIQTVDQAYKFNLLDLEDFEKYVKKKDYVTTAARFMFLHFTRSTKDYKNPMYRNSDVLLELWYSSPFVNMLNVIDAPEKRKFLHEILKSDALDYISGRHDGLVEKHLVRSLKNLFEHDSLLSALEYGRSLGQANQRHIQKMIDVYLDDLIFDKKWGNSEGLRLAAQTLKFIDGSYLQTELSNPTISILRGMFNDPLRNRIKLVSARAKAAVESEQISKYLHQSFPLRNDGRLQKPIPTLEELDLIEGHLEHLPARQYYESVIKTQDDRHKSWCETENDEKMIALRGAIDKIRPKHVGSGSSWRS
ncbi:hypothetical protein PGTUg99_003903 [Puccinia graminis f. sp. tritici]|uniref:ATPase expression protein 2, mitochondrial n=1 Tax=Puccinia graminis f. sp. tritici TaxID=56615 RepID=A0A5B0QZ93_PUCGR|nr:hypothetical protein PGTUg99_003903 [Puccinia graminis f. sp. tritici]